jgi:hypothetical protein
MSASYLGSFDLHSVVLCDGAVILGECTDARARSLTERCILERLRSGESLGRVAQSHMVLTHADIECTQRAVDEFASGLPNRRINEGLEWVPAGFGHLRCGHVDERVVKQYSTFIGWDIRKDALPDLQYGG